MFGSDIIPRGGDGVCDRADSAGGEDNSPKSRSISKASLLVGIDVDDVEGVVDDGRLLPNYEVSAITTNFRLLSFFQNTLQNRCSYSF